MSRSQELVEKAQALHKLYVEVKDLAEEHDYGIEFDTSDGTMEFNDWQSSACYGEGDEGFGINSDGAVWESSSC
jgi:hypothetical protein